MNKEFEVESNTETQPITAEEENAEDTDTPAPSQVEEVTDALVVKEVEEIIANVDTVVDQEVEGTDNADSSEVDLDSKEISFGLLLVKRLSPTAVIPRRVTDGSVGLDIATCHSAVIGREECARLGTGLSVCLTRPGFFLMLTSRSSTLVNHRLRVHPGIIDTDYRGEIIIVVENLDRKFLLRKGTFIAQLLVLPFASPSVHVLGESEDLPSTSRGVDGFGAATKRREEQATVGEQREQAQKRSICDAVEELRGEELADDDCIILRVESVRRKPTPLLEKMRKVSRQ